MNKFFLVAIVLIFMSPLKTIAQDRDSLYIEKNNAIKFITKAYRGDNSIRTKGIDSTERQPEATISFTNNGCGIVFAYSEMGKIISKETIKDINDLAIYSESYSFSSSNDARVVVYECTGGKKCVEFWHADFGVDARERAMNATFTASRNTRMISKIVDNFDIIQSACSR